MEDKKKMELGDRPLEDVSGGATIRIGFRDPNEPFDIVQNMYDRLQEGVKCPGVTCHGILQGYSREAITKNNTWVECPVVCPECGKKLICMYSESGMVKFRANF